MRGPFPFVKMQACGNDFVVVRRRDLPPEAGPTLAVALCDRHTGVGADGILVVGTGEDVDPASLRGQVPLSMTVWNADGSVSAMCGNGLRCVVRWGIEGGLLPASGSGVIGAATGLIRYDVVGDDVSVTLPPPRVLGVRRVVVDGRSVVGVEVDMGNPHFVVFEDAQDAPLPDLAAWAPGIEGDPTFPQRTNIEHVRVVEDGFAVRVWERGVGETLACGSGACAVAAAVGGPGRVGGGSEHVGGATLLLRLPGGPLSVSWAGGPADPMHLLGGATTVFSGIWGGTKETSP